MVLFHLFFFCTRPFDQKLGSSSSYFFYVHMTIRPKYMHMVLFHLFFLLCTIIRPKRRVLIDLFFLFVHNHPTKIRGHSCSLIQSFLNCANISFAIFNSVLLLYFVRSIHGSAALTLIFRALYSQKYCSCVSDAIFIAI